VKGGKLAGAGTHSYSPGDATRGSEEAARFKPRKARTKRHAAQASIDYCSRIDVQVRDDFLAFGRSGDIG
jgi:hypothetical protein